MSVSRGDSAFKTGCVTMCQGQTASNGLLFLEAIMQICLSPFIVSRSVELLTFMIPSKHELKTTQT